MHLIKMRNKSSDHDTLRHPSCAPFQQDTSTWRFRWGSYSSYPLCHSHVNPLHTHSGLQWEREIGESIPQLQNTLHLVRFWLHMTLGMSHCLTLAHSPIVSECVAGRAGALISPKCIDAAECTEQRVLRTFIYICTTNKTHTWMKQHKP